MHNLYKLLLASCLICLLGSTALLAQVPDNCPDQTVVFLDSLDNYALGDVTPQSPNFALLPGSATGLIVTDAESSTGSQSLIASDSLGSEGTLLLGELTEGSYRLTFDVYVPEGGAGIITLEHLVPSLTEYNISAALSLDSTEVGQFFYADVPDLPSTAFFYSFDTWYRFIIMIDLEGGTIQANFGELDLGRWDLSEGADAMGMDADTSIISAATFTVPEGGEFYVDNFLLLELPAPTEGSSCATAEVITEGTYSVPELVCYGAGFQTDGDDGEAGYWYEYTPATDGILQVSSCGGGADSRVWIFTGACDDLVYVGVNDDQCDLGTGDNWASYREAIVNAGQTYWIVWDDIWDTTGPDWSLTLSTEEPTPGDFCETAVPVQPNEVVAIFEFTGDAAVAGPTIGNSSQGRNPTNYANTEWYQFTPPFDGMITITSCDLSLTDNRVWLYTGECGTLESLTLEEVDDDGCEISGGPSLIENFAVTAGVTYYIEWDDGWDGDLFQWTLLYDTDDAVAVNVSVDMSEEASVNPDSVYLEDTATNQGFIRLTDNNFDNVYEATVYVANNSTFTYRFVNGETDEVINTTIGSDCTDGNNSRTVTVGTEEMTVEEVCFGYCVTCDLAVDVYDPAFAAGIAMFPNPARDQVTIEFLLPEVAQDVQVTLYNALGAQLWTRSLGTVQQLTTQVPLQQLPAGTYSVHVRSGDTVYQQRIVKQ